jgi:hypothetical protein
MEKVALGAADNALAEVSGAGLKEGMRVVLQPLANFADGMRVSPE